MAINFTVSYSFSPSTTISSSQVNTNTSDVAGVFTGLEALTKSFSNLRVDTTPTASTDVAIKSYVDKLNSYRRPVLQDGSATVINIETGINGTSGQAQILFPDGTIRTDSTAGRINCNFAQVAALSGTAQSGLRTGTVANNTRYAVYAVKVTDSTTNFVTVADTVLPVQGSFTSLNSNFGTNGWVYLGMVVNGDSSSSQTVLMSFVMAGNRTFFRNSGIGGVDTFPGILMAQTAGATSVTYTYAAGTGNAQIPSHLTLVTYLGAVNAGSTTTTISNAAASHKYIQLIGTVRAFATAEMAASEGLKLTNGSSVAMDVFWTGFVDGALGIGANPIL